VSVTTNLLGTSPAVIGGAKERRVGTNRAAGRFEQATSAVGADHGSVWRGDGVLRPIRS
jgi:hypothetical protein